jgi:hypothetical protein
VIRRWPKKNHLPVEKKSGIDSNYNYPAALFNLAVDTSGLMPVFTDLIQNIPSAYLSTPAQPPELQGLLA